jgi:pyruvate/2-oxoglutarate dehydrogenase complex dihydrolipoamide acyltransferase (E2) component
MAICATKKVPAVVDDQIVIQTQMKVTGTVDHRIIDGAEVAKFNKYFQQVFEDPDSHFKLAVETSEQLILSKKK